MAVSDAMRVVNPPGSPKVDGAKPFRFGVGPRRIVAIPDEVECAIGFPAA